MKITLTFSLSTAIAMLLLGCSKNVATAPATTQTNAQLIIGTWNRTKYEGSNTNNGADWKDITSSVNPEVNVISSGGGFKSTQNTSQPGLTGSATLTATWTLSADGITFTVLSNPTTVFQAYTISTLTTSSLVYVEDDGASNITATTYRYNRDTFSH